MLISFAALRTSCPSLLGADLLKDRFEDPQRTSVVKENFIPGMFSVKRCAWSCLCEWSHRGGAGCEMISEKGMVGQWGRELQVISPWVGPTVAQVRTGNIRLVLGCVWRKTLDGGRGVCSKHPPRQAENGACSGMSIFLLFFSLGFFLYSLFSSLLSPWTMRFVNALGFCVFRNKKLCPQLPCVSQTYKSKPLPQQSHQPLSSWHLQIKMIFQNCYLTVNFQGTAWSSAGISPSGQPGEAEMGGFCLLHWWSW